MYFPKLNAPRQSRVTVNRFPGLDRRPRGQEGSFREMENLCAQGYPTLTVRRPRGIAGSVTAPGGLTAKDGLIWVDGHTLYINGSAAGLVLSEGKKQLVSMGAWLLIWPDKLYINTKDLTDFGSLENKRVTEGEVSFTLCRPDGTAYSGYLAADTAPEEPESGSLWLDTGGEKTALRQYGQDSWTEVDDVCVGLHAAGIGVGFRAGDGVSVSGCREEALNGSFQLRAAEEDCLVVTALPSSSTGTILDVLPFTVEGMAIMDFPPLEKEAPRTKSTNPPAPLKILSAEMASAATCPIRSTLRAELTETTLSFWPMIRGSLT